MNASKCPVIAALALFCITQTGPLAFSSSTNQSPSQSTGTIRGFVLDRGTNRPIHATNVALDDGYGAVPLTDGSFTILDVQPGVHSVSAGALGYHWKTIEDVVVEAGRETVLPTILLSVRPPTSGLRLMRHDTRKWWIGDTEKFPCTYEGLSLPHKMPGHAKELSADELEVLTRFYNEIVVEWIFPLNRDHAIANPLPVMTATWSGLADAPSSFFATISSDTLATVKLASAEDVPFYCVLKVNQQVSPDTLEVEASLRRKRGGVGRRALAMRNDGHWKFCLQDGTFSISH